MFLELLPELQDIVFAYLNIQDIKSLIRCSCSYYESVRKRLWESFTILDIKLLRSDFNGKTFPRHNMKYTKTLRFDTDSFVFTSLDNDMELKLYENCNEILDLCNLTELHTEFLSKTAIDNICKQKNLEKLSIAFKDTRKGYFLKICDHLPTLSTLILRDATFIGDKSGNIQRLLSLRVLDLHECYLTDMELKDVLSLQKLTTLRVKHCNGITRKGLYYLGTSRLTELLLFACDIDDKVMFSIASILTLNSLTIRYSPLANEGLQSLKSLVRLKELDFGWGDNPRLNISFVSSLTSLNKLSVRYVKLADEDMACLRGLRKLKRLDLRYIPLTDNFLSYLSELPELKYVRLQIANITKTALLESWKKMPNLKKVRWNFDTYRYNHLLMEK